MKDETFTHPYWDNDDEKWHYLCFRLYRFLADFTTLKNLITLQLLRLIDTKGIVKEGDSDLKGSGALRVEMERHARVSNSEEDYSHFDFWLYRDLIASGNYAMKHGVSLDALSKLHVDALDIHRNYLSSYIDLLCEPEYRSTLLKNYVEKNYPREAKKRKRSIRSYLKPAMQERDFRAAISIVSEIILPRFGITGCYEALCQIQNDIPLGSQQNDSFKSFENRKKEQESFLVWRIVETLKLHSVKGVYPLATRMANGLLAYPKYETQRDPVSLRSKGQQRIRSHYHSAVAKFGGEKNK